MNFELAAIQAARSAYQGAQIFGCFFHLAKNMQKHLATVPHALTRYRTDANFALQCKAIIATAFVPLSMIDQAMLALERHLSLSLTFLLDWFEDNYVGMSNPILSFFMLSAHIQL